MNEILIYSKLSSLPKKLQREVLDFMDFLMYKAGKRQPTEKQPKFGSAKGRFKMSPDFDEPLDDFDQYMK